VQSRGPEASESDAALVGAALELAVARARRDASTPGSPPPPTALRPVLRFSRLPGRALRTVHQVLDTDDGFRARVAEGVAEADLDRASWLFLTRPEGWADELSMLRAEADELAAGRDASRQEHSAERRLAQVTEALERTRTELRDATARADAATAELAGERSARAELAERVDELDAARAHAVRNLKQAEALSTTRLAELRASQDHVEQLEARLVELEAAVQLRMDLPDVAAGGPAGGTAAPTAALPVEATPASPWQGIDPTEVARAVEQAASAAAQLGAALRVASDALAASDHDELTSRPVPEPTETVDGRGDDAACPDRVATAGAMSPRPPRRTPVRLRRGVHEGSADALEQLLGTPEVVLVVDGYNVSMEAWPTLDRSGQRSSLVALLGGLRARSGAVVHVVFDGDDDGRRPSVAAPLPVRVHYSHAEVEADDVILDMVARLPTDVPVVVVSSDRRVADGARRLGANVVSSSELIDLSRR
jgi:predicted RNA-binding protein with PIN domain